MRIIISDTIIAGFIWVLLYFMFRPAQDIMHRAAEETHNTLEILIISGFIATLIIDIIIRQRIKNKKKNNKDDYGI
jgi:hypothetical protein